MSSQSKAKAKAKAAAKKKAAADKKQATQLKAILKSVGVNVSTSQVQSAQRSISAGGNSGGGSSSSNKPYEDSKGNAFATHAEAAASEAKIRSGGSSVASTNTPAGMSQTQFIDYLVSQGLVTDKNKAYETLGIADPNAQTEKPAPELKIDEANPFMQPGNLPPGWENYSDTQKALYNGDATMMYQALLAGKELNPNVELSPEVLKKFTEDATAQLDPYYQEKFGLEKNKFETSISNMMADYNKNLGRVDTGFKETLGAQAQGEAESGTAFSSGRVQREGRTIDLKNQELQDYTTGIQRTGQELATDYEKQFGSAGLRTLNIPGLTEYKASTGGVAPSATRSLYAPLGNIALGEQNKARELAIKNEADVLEQSYRGNRSLTGQY